MTRTAKALAWTALIFGVPPMLVCMTWIFAGGLRMFLFLGLIAFPPLPLVLTQDSTSWQKPRPIVPLAVAIVSLLISVVLYLQFFRVRIWLQR